MNFCMRCATLVQPSRREYVLVRNDLAQTACPPPACGASCSAAGHPCWRLAANSEPAAAAARGDAAHDADAAGDARCIPGDSLLRGMSVLKRLRQLPLERDCFEE